MHVHAEDIDLYARRRLSESQRHEIETHLAGCPACRSKVTAAIEFSQALARLRQETAEMRAAHRIPTDDPATIQILSPMSPDRWDVRIRDVSKGGLCVRTRKAIDRGAQVKIQRGGTIACGEVRYCVPVGEMFHVGIRLLEVLSGPALHES
jgi:predicted anti-sigma-YlaC factor YlaD